MASTKSAKYPHKWPDGTYHSIPWEQTKRAQATATSTPPPGTYDPNIDAELGKGQRGLANLTEDIGSGEGGQPLGTQRGRAQDDFLSGLAKIDQSSGRSLSDLLTARTHGAEDFNTSIADLQRNYVNLGTQQAGAQRKAGVDLGGAAAQAAEKRAANEAHDRAPIDTAYNRFKDQSTEDEKRLGQDTKTARDELGLGFGRQSDDWTTQLKRAGVEQSNFEGDSLSAKVAQFNQLYPGQKVPVTPGAFPGQKVAPAAANPAKGSEVKISTPKGFVPISDWDFGYGKGVLTPPKKKKGFVV